MVAISVALLLICCRALLLILQVSDCLIHHVALLLVGDSALLLTLGVKDCPALCLSELIALLLVSNVLELFWSLELLLSFNIYCTNLASTKPLRALYAEHCEALCIHSEVYLGYK